MDTTRYFIIAHRDDNNSATVERKLRLPSIDGDLEVVVVNTNRRSQILPTLKKFKKRVDEGEIKLSLECQNYLAKLCRIAELGSQIFTSPSGEMTKVIEKSLEEDWEIDRKNVMFF